MVHLCFTYDIAPRANRLRFGEDGYDTQLTYYVAGFFNGVPYFGIVEMDGVDRGFYF